MKRLSEVADNWEMKALMLNPSLYKELTAIIFLYYAFAILDFICTLETAWASANDHSNTLTHTVSWVNESPVIL